MRNQWVLADSVRVGEVWHRVLKNGGREIETYCGKTIRLHPTNVDGAAQEPGANACGRCSVMATRA